MTDTRAKVLATGIVADHLRPLFVRTSADLPTFDRALSEWGRTAPWLDNQPPGETTSRPTDAMGAERLADPLPEGRVPDALREGRGDRAGLLPRLWTRQGLTILASVLLVIALVFLVQALPREAKLAPRSVGGPEAGGATPDTPVRDGQARTGQGGAGLSGTGADPEALWGSVELELSGLAQQYGGAPTLMELVDAGFFGAARIERVARLTGLPREYPLGLDGALRPRIVQAALFLVHGQIIRSGSQHATIAVPELRRSVLDLQGAFASDLLEKGSGARSLAVFAPVGRRVAVSGPRALGEVDEAVRIFDAQPSGIPDWRQVYGGEPLGGSAVVMQFSPDGLRLVRAPAQGALQVYERARDSVWTSRALAPPAELDSVGRVTGLLMDVTGSRLLVKDASSSARIYSMAPSGTAGWALILTVSTGKSAVIAPTRAVIGAATNGAVLLWNGDGGALVARYPLPGAGGNGAEVVAPGPETGTAAASLGNRLFWLSAEGAGEPVLLSEEGGAIASLAFSLDGQVMVAGRADGAVSMWRRNLSELPGWSPVALPTPVTGAISSAPIDPHAERIVTTETNGDVRVWTSAFTAMLDEMDQSRWSTARIAERFRADADRQKIALPVASDEEIARQIAAVAFDHGRMISLSDAPWEVEPAAPPLAPDLARDNVPLIAALLALAAGVAGWFGSAWRLRSYLDRRRGGGRIVDLFAKARDAGDRAQAGVRRAARALLRREDSGRRIDLRATVAASASSAGLFSPRFRAAARLPEYLFLIDSHARADHEARRALDYLNRLEQERVPITRYFFERAPDRLRSEVGKPARSLESVLAENAGKRLVIIGDAASMLDPERMTPGKWSDSLRNWPARALLTTIPRKEWGVEEAAFARGVGIGVGRLSAEGLEHLPRTLSLADGSLADRLVPEGDLAAPALPEALRKDPDRWRREVAPSNDEFAMLEGDLLLYLGVAGWRWLCACAVYPALEWELTVALAQELKTPSGEPVFTEALAARLAQLPWMRAGEMPDWLRARLIDELPEDDRVVIRTFIQKILISIDRKPSPGEDVISLRFGHARGRAPDRDERFVEFVTRMPDSRERSAIEATRKLRAILRPPFWRRLAEPAGLAWLAGGVLIALAAWLAAPRLAEAPSHSGAWAPLVVLAIIAGLFGVVATNRKRMGKISRALFAPRPVRAPLEDALGAGRRSQVLLLRLQILFGGARNAAADTLGPSRREGFPTARRMGRLLRRSVKVWVSASLLWLCVGVILLPAITVPGVPSLAVPALGRARGQPLMDGMLLLLLAFAAALMAATGWALWRFAKRLGAVAADSAARGRSELLETRRDGMGLVVSVLACLLIASVVSTLIGGSLSGASGQSGLIAPIIVLVVLLAAAGQTYLSTWRYATMLNAIDLDHLVDPAFLEAAAHGTGGERARRPDV